MPTRYVKQKKAPVKQQIPFQAVPKSCWLRKNTVYCEGLSKKNLSFNPWFCSSFEFVQQVLDMIIYDGGVG
jgi:hypothetical protein